MSRENTTALAAPASLPASGETAGIVLAAQAKAIIEARTLVALNRPRDMNVVRERLLRECANPDFADDAIYRKPIGEGIEGPSIRFVEAAIRSMGNIDTQTPAIYDDGERRILRVSVTDLETNNTYSKDVSIHKTVERLKVQPGDEVLRTRQNREGKTLHIRIATDDEILNTENALVSKAIRSTGLRLVPSWLVSEAMTLVRATQAKKDALDPSAEAHKLLDGFRSVGVSAANITEWLGGRQPENVTPAELKQLRGIYVAIRDGEATWKDVMDERWQEGVQGMSENAAAAAGAPKTTDRVKDKIRKKLDAEKKTAPGTATDVDGLNKEAEQQGEQPDEPEPEEET